MTSFILTATLLTLVGLMAFVPGLLNRAGSKAGVDRKRLNLALHEARRQEIENESNSPDEVLQLDQDLDRTLLEDLEALGKEDDRPQQRGGRTGLLALLALIPILAVVGYLNFGRPDLLAHPPMAAREEARNAIQELAERLKANPADLEGWVLLGRSLQSTQRPAEAVKAFEMAARLAPEDLDLKALYAEALAEAQEGKLEGQPGVILKEILQKNPKHKMALWLGGLAAAQAGDLGTARTLWQRLRELLPKESPEMAEINEYLQQLGPETGAKPAPAKAGVKVKISLDPKVLAEAQPDEAVFIFARAAKGPPMPLAVIRKTVKDLPLEVTLDDSLAMRPGLEISNYDEVILGARISKSGQAMPQSGEWEGATSPIKPEPSKRYAVVIDHKHP
jgi:cytochrome c-type biogenesis protein CcmH